MEETFEGLSFRHGYCKHEITVAVVNCTRLTKVQDSQDPGIDKEVLLRPYSLLRNYWQVISIGEELLVGGGEECPKAPVHGLPTYLCVHIGSTNWTYWVTVF